MQGEASKKVRCSTKRDGDKGKCTRPTGRELPGCPQCSSMPDIQPWDAPPACTEVGLSDQWQSELLSCYITSEMKLERNAAYILGFLISPSEGSSCHIAGTPRRSMGKRPRELKSPATASKEPRPVTCTGVSLEVILQPLLKTAGLADSLTPCPERSGTRTTQPGHSWLPYSQNL